MQPPRRLGMLVHAMAPFSSSRRRFCVSSAAGLLATAAPRFLSAASVSSRLATESYIWLQSFEAHHLSVAEGLPQMFAGVRAAGYRRLEISADWLTSDLLPLALRLSRQYGVAMPFVYTDGVMHQRDGADKTIAIVSALADRLREPLDLEAVVFNPAFKPHNALKTGEELAIQAEALNHLGEALKRRGLHLFVHAHAPEMQDHAREWRHNLHHTEPGLVSICADINWFFMGGANPLELLREAGPRVASLHIRNSSRGIWLESLDEHVQPLDVNYAAVTSLLRQEHLSPWLVVELAYMPGTAVTRSLPADLLRSRRWAEYQFQGL